MSHYKFDPCRYQISLVDGLLRAQKTYGSTRKIFTDVDDREFSYTEIVRGMFGLGAVFKRLIKNEKNIGIILPTGAGALLTFLGLQVSGHVPAMLNFSAGMHSIKSSCKAAEIKTIITARRFIELGNLQDIETALAQDYKLVYLEDIRESMGLWDKLTALLGPFLPKLFAHSPHYDDPAAILFTSGTEGTPKGVVLSHKNIMSNVEQVLSSVKLYPEFDVCLNPLPAFHCFGLVMGMLMTTLAGIKSIQHPTPLTIKEICERVGKHKATLLLATDTFLLQYARADKVNHLKSLRLAVCGAERVRDETRQFIQKKYNLEIREGYGLTEAAPFVSACPDHNNKYGSVGPAAAGIECILEPVEGINDGGLLKLRGPNIMLGYLYAEKPGVLHPPQDGWHNTGDIVSLDEDGFIHIRGRIKRFAKVAGEMVSLAVVENCVNAIWPEAMHAATVMPDAKKGEQIVLLTTSTKVNRNEILGWMRNHGVPEIALPRKIFIVDDIPILGSGKTNYGEVQRMAEVQMALT